MIAEAWAAAERAERADGVGEVRGRLTQAWACVERVFDPSAPAPADVRESGTWSDSHSAGAAGLESGARAPRRSRRVVPGCVRPCVCALLPRHTCAAARCGRAQRRARRHRRVLYVGVHAACAAWHRPWRAGRARRERRVPAAVPDALYPRDAPRGARDARGLLCARTVQCTQPHCRRRRVHPGGRAAACARPRDLVQGVLTTTATQLLEAAVRRETHGASVHALEHAAFPRMHDLLQTQLVPALEALLEARPGGVHLLDEPLRDAWDTSVSHVHDDALHANPEQASLYLRLEYRLSRALGHARYVRPLTQPGAAVRHCRHLPTEPRGAERSHGTPQP